VSSGRALAAVASYEMIQLECVRCDKKFLAYPYEVRNNRKFCSKLCGTLYTNKSRSEKMLGNKNRKHTSESKTRLRYCNLGTRNPNWKGGITTKIQHLRNSSEYEHWRNAVLKKDNYMCVLCGRKDLLHTHHLESFWKNEELRFDIENGIAVCIDCHSDIHGFLVGILDTN